jgi:hypothetical protein
MNPSHLIQERTRRIPSNSGSPTARSADPMLVHVLAELRRLALEGVLSAEGGERVVRRDAYAGSFELDLRAFSELAATVADGSGLRGFYLARDGFRDDGAVGAINSELARCGIAGYTAWHRTTAGENGVAVTDVHGRELPRPAHDTHGRELLGILAGLADESGVAAYTVALANRDEQRLCI